MASYGAYKGAAGVGLPVGTIVPWAKASVPSGFLLCDGSAVSRTTYADLYAIIADAYGAGDGSTTFNVPNIRGKQMVFDDASTYVVGGSAGSSALDISSNATITNNQSITGNVTISGNIANTALTTDQIPAHSHRMFGSSQANQLSLPISTNSTPAYWRASVGTALSDDYLMMQSNTSPNLGLSGASGAGGGHTHSHNLTGASNLALSGSVNASFNTFNPLFSSTVVRAVIKF